MNINGKLFKIFERKRKIIIGFDRVLIVDFRGIIVASKKRLIFDDGWSLIVNKKGVVIKTKRIFDTKIDIDLMADSRGYIIISDKITSLVKKVVFFGAQVILIVDCYGTVLESSKKKILVKYIVVIGESSILLINKEGVIMVFVINNRLTNFFFKNQAIILFLFKNFSVVFYTLFLEKNGFFITSYSRFWENSYELYSRIAVKDVCKLAKSNQKMVSLTILLYWCGLAEGPVYLVTSFFREFILKNKDNDIKQIGFSASHDVNRKGYDLGTFIFRKLVDDPEYADRHIRVNMEKNLYEKIEFQIDSFSGKRIVEFVPKNFKFFRIEFFCVFSDKISDQAIIDSIVLPTRNFKETYLLDPRQNHNIIKFDFERKMFTEKKLDELLASKKKIKKKPKKKIEEFPEEEFVY